MKPSSYECSFWEGLAVYGGIVGVGAGIWDTPSAEGRPKPEVVAFVVALFNDLSDGATGSSPDNPSEIDEPKDKTHYSAHYVMKVFATCEVKHPSVIPFLDDWEERNDVFDFVWCLENRTAVNCRPMATRWSSRETPTSSLTWKNGALNAKMLTTNLTWRLQAA